MKKEIKQKTNKAETEEFTKLEVTIFGTKYTMKAEKDATKMLKIVKMVNETMEEVANRQPGLAYKEVSVLAALNLAEKLLDSEEEYRNLQEIISEGKE